MNVLFNKDAFDYLPEIGNKTIDLVITDPPYWHKKSPGKPYSERNAYDTDSAFANSSLYKADGYMMKNMSDFGEKDVNKLLDELNRVMKIMNAYIFCNDTLVPYYTMWAEKNGLMFSILVWEKPLSIINKNRFSQNIEYIVRVYDYGTALNKLDENLFYSKVKRYNVLDKMHPTQKPTTLLREFILLSSKKGDVILDPFMGGGTTAIACMMEERNWVGSEINKEIYEDAKKRIQQHKSQTQLF